MNKWYWISVGTVAIIGLSATLYFGLQGKTVPLIRWSHFADSKEVSDAIERRMRQELQPYQIYFIGPHPQKPMHVETAIRLANWIRSQGENVLITDTILTERDPSIQNLKADLVLDLVRDKDRFIEGLKNVDPKKKIVVIAPNIYVTHYFGQSAVSQLQDELKNRNYIVLSMVNFPGSREEEKDFEFPCRTTEGEGAQLEFGCFILGQSRRFYVKERIEGKTPGFLNLIRSREYMLFLGK